MAGEYGLTAGINQGFQQVNQGMMNAESIQSSREARRLAAEKQQVYMQQADLQQKQGNVQLQNLQLQLDKLTKSKAQDDAYNAFHAYEETSDAKYLNLAMQKNELIKGLYPDIISPSNLSDFSEENLTSM